MALDPDLSVAIAAFCDQINSRLTAAAKRGGWVEAKPGPNYVKVVHHVAPSTHRDRYPSTFRFIARDDRPFGWSNYRRGDILPPQTSRKPWKMDTGAVGNLIGPDGGMSYWVERYGNELGWW